MRRTIAALAVLPLAIAAIAAGETPELPDPIDVTMYFHGDDNTQIVDEDAYQLGKDGGRLVMDRTAPTDNSYETKAITNYAQGPNARCAGNGLLPVWVGFLSGTLEGFGTVTFDVLGGTGGEVVVDVFTDVNGQACNEAYPEPVASATVVLPEGVGDATAVLDLDGISVGTYLMVQIRGADSANGIDNPQPNPGAPVWPSRIAPTDPTAQGRIVYDGTNFLSGITLTCQPDALAEGETAEDADCLPF